MDITQHPANEARSDRAKIALMAYHNQVNAGGSEAFDLESTLTDLLVDLHHFADFEKLGFYCRYAQSDYLYKAELEDPEL